jgi:uncharacterized protein involved in exopolysaccharide biosynthesis
MGLSLEQLLSILWARRWLSLGVVALILAATAAAISLWPRRYSATLTLMVNYEVTDPLNGNHLPLGQVGSYIATQIELLQTPEVLLAVVDRLHLTDDDEFSGGYGDGRGTLREWTASNLRKSLSVYQGSMGSQLIHVTFVAHHPQTAAAVANAVADQYKEQDYLRSTAPPAERAARYQQQLGELKDKVARAQRESSAFRQRHGLMDEATRSNVDLTLLSNLEQRMQEARNVRRSADARETANAAVSDEVLASPEVQALKLQLTTQELRLAHLNTLYTPRHPDIVELNDQIATTRRQLAGAIGSYSANTVANRETAIRLDRTLQAAVAEQRSRVLAAGQLQDESAKYQLELESAQSVYKRALEGFDQVMFASTGHLANVVLVSMAAPPVRPSSPKVLSGLALGSLAAAFFGLAAPLGMEFLNRRVRCRDDLERELRIPVFVEFGELPRRLRS